MKKTKDRVEQGMSRFGIITNGAKLPVDLLKSLWFEEELLFLRWCYDTFYSESWVTRIGYYENYSR